jgi:hypothetical protein
LAGGWHGMHEVPQFAVSLLETQLPLQLWVPAGQLPSQALPCSMQDPLQILVLGGQLVPHFVPSQVALPPAGMGQGVQPVPQVRGSVLRAQVLPHAWYPVLQARTHLSPSHEVWPLGEVGQVTQAVPHVLTLARSTQMPLQGFCPSGHFSSHATLSATHLSMQGFCPAGHWTPHLTPSHVASPPMIPVQGLQATPQLMGNLLSTQVPLQL